MSADWLRGTTLSHTRPRAFSVPAWAGFGGVCVSDLSVAVAKCMATGVYFDCGLKGGLQRQGGGWSRKLIDLISAVNMTQRASWKWGSLRVTSESHWLL